MEVKQKLNEADWFKAKSLLVDVVRRGEGAPILEGKSDLRHTKSSRAGKLDPGMWKLDGQELLKCGGATFIVEYIWDVLKGQGFL